MHRQIAADAVAGAVVEIEAGRPQRRRAQAVELRAGRALRETRAVAIAMWPLSTRVKRSRISAVGSPTVTVRVMSVVPSAILGAGVDQEELAGCDVPVGLRGDAVMDDGAVGAGARDGRERHVLEHAGLAAEVSSALTASISVSLPRGASRSNQARKRATAAPSRRWAARAPAISVAFFTAFMLAIGSAPSCTVPPASGSSAQGFGAGRLIEAHGLVGAPERGEGG